jgi:TubC N-terminal docking domain
MIAADIIKDAAAAGVQISLDGDKITLRAKAKPSDELLVKLKAQKAEIVSLLAARQFLAATRTIWPEARFLTEAERADDTQFREFCAKKTSKVYANPTPWARK